MRDLLLFLVFFSLVLATFFRPHIGILVWAWIGYMNPHRLILWGASAQFRFALICGAVTLLALFLSRETKKLPIGGVSLLMIALMIWLSLTTILSGNLESTVGGWEKSMKILLMTLLTMVLLQSRERIHALVWIIVVSVGFYGVKGALWFMTSRGGGLVWGPSGSFIEDNTSLGLALVMIIPLLYYLQAMSAILWVRFGLAMAGLLCVVSIVGTYSRGAFIAVSAMAIMIFLRSRRRFMLGVLGVFGVLALVIYAPEKWIERMQSIANYQEDLSAMGRLHTWEFAINLALENPIFGGGFRAYNDPNLWSQFAPVDALRQRTYHSIYFEMLGDHGFVGLGIFLALGLAGWITARRVIRLTRDRPDFEWANQLSRMIQVSIVGFAVGGIFLSLSGFDLYYHLLAIAFLLQVVVNRELGNPELQRSVPAAGVSEADARSPSSAIRSQRPIMSE